MIQFFTHDMPAGKVADFQADVSAPWGAHRVRGSIIQSQRTNDLVVLWPKISDRFFASTPATRHDTEQAARWILDKFREFQTRGASR